MVLKVGDLCILQLFPFSNYFKHNHENNKQVYLSDLFLGIMVE